MKKKALRKDFYMEVKKSLNRFISIFLIVALGVAFYSGIQSAAPDMRYSGDAYFDQHQLMDVKIMSTMGLTKKDVEAIGQTAGVELTEPGYMTDVLCQKGTDQYALRVESITPTLNQLTAAKGRLPKNAGECFVDIEFLEKAGYSVGDTITFFREDEDAYKLKEKEFTIVGAGSSPLYISFNRGNTTLGTGELAGAVYVLPKDFDYEVYTTVYIKVKEADNLTAYTDAYDTCIAKVQKRIEAISGERCEIRYQEIQKEANEKLADARKELTDGEAEAKSKLADAWTELCDGDKKIQDARKKLAKAKRELKDGEKKIQDGEKELADGKQQLIKNEQKLADGRAQLKDGWTRLNQGKKELKSKQKEFDSTYQETITKLDVAQEQLDQKKAELADGHAQYEEGKAEYEKQLAQYQDSETAYAKGKAQYDAAVAAWPEQKKELEKQKAEAKAGLSALQSTADSLAEAKAQAEAATAQLEEAVQAVSKKLAALQDRKAELEKKKARLDKEKQAAQDALGEGETLDESLYELSAAEKEELHTLQGQIADVLAELDAQNAALRKAQEQQSKAQEASDAVREQIQQLQGSIAQIETGIVSTEATLAENKAQLAATREQLDEGKVRLDAAPVQLEESLRQLKEGDAAIVSAQNEIDAGRTELEEGRQKLEEAQKTIAKNEEKLKASEAELKKGEALLAAGKEKLADAERKLEKAKKTVADGKKKIADGEKELAENEDKLAEGKTQYEESKKEAEDEIADGKRKLADAEKEAADLKMPEWTVSDRSDLPENIGYGENADRMRNIGQVFPVMFFLVAALISLTTMTRMVEEERTQIGTLKALGYGKAAIASKYLCYALLATLGGSLVGVALGEKFLPYVIVTSYRILYHHMTNIELPYNMKYALIATIAALASTMLATLAACYKELSTTPAVLMRPPVPKEGKRVFLERVPFLWKHLSFSWKSTIRNLLRYKKRFFMTVFGIGGCMALMLVGYGLRDSISDVGHLQFRQLQLYDAMVIMDADASEKDKESLKESIDKKDTVANATEALLQKETVRRDKKSWNVYLMVPKETERVGEFLVFRDRQSGEKYPLTDKGAIITEKIAGLCGVKAGDTIVLEDEKLGNIQVPIAAVTENYLSHYIYMTPELYEACTGKVPEYNEIVFKTEEGTDEEMLEHLGQSFLNEPAALSISYTQSTMSQIDSMLSTLDAVIVVLIVSAGLLAFVVLYNLSNININERKRELATLKVLGFYDVEVDAYVYRENILITAIGILAGIGLGKILHYFVITTVEVDATMFGRNINLPSYLTSAAFTVVFSVFVNAVMHQKLKKINMVESLKSIE